MQREMREPSTTLQLGNTAGVEPKAIKQKENESQEPKTIHNLSHSTSMPDLNL